MIEKICEKITSLLDGIRIPAPEAPSILLALSQIDRPGLSAKSTASTIITRQVDAGAPVGPLSDGKQSVAEAMEVIRIEEIFKAIKQDAKTQVAIPIGAITIQSFGANAGGPIITTGFNLLPVKGYAKIS